MQRQIEIPGTNTQPTCYSCKHFSELKEPRAINKDSSIYGCCLKHGTATHNLNMGKGLAVYVPEGACKERVKRLNHENT